MNFSRLLVPICFLAFANCTHRNLVPATDALSRKSEPYDHFSMQRSWPDTAFNWRAWRTALHEATTTAAAERNPGCSGPGVSNTPWTLQGPSNIAGRVNTLAVKPGDENTVLAGFAGGGIFKSTDAGVTWTPVFDDFPQLSIGKIAFDPSNPNTVYAGTGDVNMPSMVYNGDGLFKSTDAGNTWTKIGLENAGIISQIIVHPSDPQTIWVASMGNPYTRNNERGVFKTTNGGQTWQKVLFVSNQAGCSSLVMSVANPQILYASFWDRIRNNYESIISGPNAVVYKSTDGGNTWQQLSGGLPTGNNGRTGLAVSQQNPDKVYALYIDTLATPGVMFRSLDGGATWQDINIVALEDACGDFGWYFGKLSLDPINDDDIYFHGILLSRRLANGNWIVASGGHADSHDLVFCPSGRRYWANDGGVYRNEPGNQGWTKSKNLPATQVYRTNYNQHTPNEYWLGAQDNGIKRGNAAVINNWTDVFSADGFRTMTSPYGPDTIWVEIQNGNVSSSPLVNPYWSSSGNAFGTSDRVNWDAPVFRSQNPPYRFYAGTYRVLTSPNGLGYGGASPDLTDGVIYLSRLHTITCLSESPATADKLFAGTGDGNVWWRSPSGTWTEITAGLPTRYVTSVVGSPINTQRIFVTHSGFRDDDYIPHIHRSDNNGVSWIDISGDLPQVPVNQIFVVPGQGDSVLVAGTDAGPYATRNRGQNWFRLGNNMPAVPVVDMAHNVARKEIVAATFGRGIWTFPIDSIQVQPGPPVMVDVDGLLKSVSGGGVAYTSFPDINAITASDADGYYTLDSLPGCTEVTLTPYRNDDPVNGVNAWDLVLISRHILNLEPIVNPYNLIAADANKSGTVTTFDIVTLRKLILGTDTVFTGNTSWRFIPSSFSFAHPNNPFVDNFPEYLQIPLEQLPYTAENFTGIKVGDIDNSNIPAAQSPLDERNMPVFPVFCTSGQFQKGESINIPVQADFSEIAAVQFTITFDPAVLRLEQLVNLAPGIHPDEHFNLKHASEGQISFVLEQLPTLNGPLFELPFTALADGNWSKSIRISSLITPSRAYLREGTALRPVLVWESPERVLEIFPNPSSGAAVWVRSAVNGPVTIVDALGRVVEQLPAVGNQAMRLPNLAKGLYRVVVFDGENYLSRALVID